MCATIDWAYTPPIFILFIQRRNARQRTLVKTYPAGALLPVTSYTQFFEIAAEVGEVRAAMARRLHGVATHIIICHL